MNKIVFIAPSIKTGGGNRVFIELANILCEEYDISVLFPNNSEEYHTFQKSSNLQYTAIGKKALSKMAKFMSLYSLCKQAFGKCRFSYIRPNLLPFNSFYKKQKEDL